MHVPRPLLQVLVVLPTLTASAPSGRDPRWFNIFTVQRFENSVCASSDGPSLPSGKTPEGICTLPVTCTGRTAGSCAGGLGACCVVEKSCGGTTSQKVAYFTNANYPQTDTQDQSCQHRLQITDPDVCQIRLDLETFETLGPETVGSSAGTCDASYLTLEGSSADLQHISGKLCGQLTGQHLYAHVNQLRGDAVELSVTVRLMGETGGARWRIKATQVDCSRRTSQRAPAGCTQYFNETKGSFESFNYPGSVYTRNQDYSICIGSAFNACKTTFSSDQFSLDMVTTSATSGVGASSCDVQTSGGNIRSDYLFIPGGSELGDSPTREKYCGDVLHYAPGQIRPEPVVTKVPGPVALRFKTDDNFNTNEIGFRVDYEQSTTC